MENEYQLSENAIQLYTTILNSAMPVQKSAIVGEISCLDDYEWEKTKNLLQGRGLIRYNEKTQKMTITMPRS